MNELTQEWIDKAEGDFITATSLLNLHIEATVDAICYHCQQSAEKYAKAYLQHQFIEFPRTHNLMQLLSLCQERDNSFLTLSAEMSRLNDYGVDVRYPGRFTSFEEAEGAVSTLQTVRTFIRSKLNLQSE